MTEFTFLELYKVSYESLMYSSVLVGPPKFCDLTLVFADFIFRRMYYCRNRPAAALSVVLAPLDSPSVLSNLHRCHSDVWRLFTASSFETLT